MRNFLLILTSILALNSVAAASDVVSGEPGNWAVEDSLIQTQYIDEVLHFTVDHQGILDSIAALSEAQGRTVAEGITNVFALYDTLLAATAGGEDPTDSGDNTSDEFQSCGDSLTYNTYKYPTIEIGNDCWFAENLRTETDSAGASIPSGLSDTEWENATGAAFSVLDEGGDDEATNRETFGLLYNWYAVDAGLCPAGWHVATQSEFETIIDANGGASDAGEAMKSSDTDDPAWNGTNTTGFSGLKNARRRTTGEFNNFNDGYIWTSTNGGVKAKGLRLRSSENSADLDERFKENGFAVRCVQNPDDAGDTSDSGDNTSDSGDTSNSGDNTSDSGDTTGDTSNSGDNTSGSGDTTGAASNSGDNTSDSDDTTGGTASGGDSCNPPGPGCPGFDPCIIPLPGCPGFDPCFIPSPGCPGFGGD